MIMVNIFLYIAKPLIVHDALRYDKKKKLKKMGEREKIYIFIYGNKQIEKILSN